MYREVADHVDEVIGYLRQYKNTKEDFYSVRELDWAELSKAEAAYQNDLFEQNLL